MYSKIKTPLLIFNSLLIDEAIKIFLTIDQNNIYKKVYEENNWVKIKFYHNPYLKFLFKLNSLIKDNGQILIESEINLGTYHYRISLNQFYKHQLSKLEQIIDKISLIIFEYKDEKYFPLIKNKKENDKILINNLFINILNLIKEYFPESIIYSPNQITITLDENLCIKYFKKEQIIGCHLIHNNNLVFEINLNKHLNLDFLNKLFKKHLN